MNNIFKVSLLAGAVLAAAGCNDKQAETAPKAAESEVVEAVSAAVETAPVAEFANEDAKAAYAIGASVSRYIEKTLAEQEQLGVTLDKEQIIAGISDALRGELKLKDEDVIATLQAYDKKLSEIAQAKQAEATEKSKTEATAYLAENAKKEGVTTTDSGLQYQVLTAAEGDKPNAEDTVTVHYEGRLLNGEVFDSSMTRGQPATFPLNRVIAGWTEGVQLMSVGSKYQFTIPAELAYGDQGAGNIPPHSALIFDVELLSIEKAAAEPVVADEKAAE
ncbi:FKBP-type peptidyl-prolyl cis-trans isomerase [Motilimonas sp. 1_MG-2023]|uniref:FKBP-type peptidyl-prolyl cis-trans isomerase n=1 Tax=Motilimonas sp. 1_MG-2023 TaxID=3062672 RepID=UPI0026E17CD3|nr:FKBP-type peptidyl-prolyl cis-trans isomerase [Motilimonas sp. 1_MG-2023]MDO6527688.1 FKBP-type peptidyl-prolyl cis-trans isomerase [Motilimonas sp. 1_MG-2023]